MDALGHDDAELGQVRADRVHQLGALAHQKIPRLVVQKRPVALQRTVQERLHPLVDLFAQPRHLALRGARQPHGTHQVVDRAGRDAVDVGFLDHRHQRLLRRPARLQERREVTALAQLRDVQADRAGPGIPLALSIAIPLVLPVRAALAVARAAHGSHLDIHQPLRSILDQLAQKIRVIALGDHPRKVDHGVGHRALLRCHRSLNNRKLRRSAVAASPAARCATPKAPRAASYTTRWGTTQILRQHRPLAARRRDVEDRVHDFPQVRRSRTSQALRRRHEGLDQRPFAIRHVACVSRGVSRRYSRRAVSVHGIVGSIRCGNQRESQAPETAQLFSSWALRGARSE